jgi:zinc/manganese transport system substrate-binding protein
LRGSEVIMRKIFKRIILSIAAACVFFSTVAAYANKPIILTTTTDLADITRSVVKERAEVSSIATGLEDPHFLTAKPGFIVRARDADVWIRVGLELEVGWEEPILRDSRNRRIQEGAPGHIDASTDVLVLDVPAHPVTRDMGDVHAHGNPHYWLDPLNGRIIARTIAMRLGNLYPEHAAAFMQNLAAFEKALDEAMFGPKRVSRHGGALLWKQLIEQQPLPVSDDNPADEQGGWYDLLLPYQGHAVVTYHRSWIYFAQRFGIRIPVELEPKPGIPPSSRHLSRVIETIRKENVRVILQEPLYSLKAADFVARHTGATVLVCPNTVHGSTDVASFIQMIDRVVRSLARAMGQHHD